LTGVNDEARLKTEEESPSPSLNKERREEDEAGHRKGIQNSIGSETGAAAQKEQGLTFQLVDVSNEGKSNEIPVDHIPDLEAKKTEPEDVRDRDILPKRRETISSKKT